ncbi:unnamed protein product [Rhizopus stolonifer]
MTSFAITRPGPKLDSSTSQQIYNYLQQNTMPLEQHVNGEFFGPNISTHEENSLLSLEKYPILEECWDYSVSCNQFEKNTQDMDSFLDYHGLLEERNCLPENDMVNLYENTTYPDYSEASTDGLSTVLNYPAIDSLDPKDHLQPTFSTKDRMLSLGGKLSWQQSISPEKKSKRDEFVIFQSQYKLSTRSSTLPSLVTDEEFGRQTKKQRISEHCTEDCATPFIASSISEPLPSFTHYPSTPSFTEPRKRANSFQYNHMSLGTKITLGSPLSDGSSNDYHQQHQVDPTNYMESNNIVANFPDSCHSHLDLPQNQQVLLSMPRRQKQRYEGDYYTPNWVRYTGHLKEGYCDSCHPGKWLQLKNSAYWYHKQFYHGISSVTGKPFNKPIEQRLGKGSLTEGLCHQCQRFVPVCNSKKKNNYMLWYRHAHKCHLHDKNKMIPKTVNKQPFTSPTTSTTD